MDKRTFLKIGLGAVATYVFYSFLFKKKEEVKDEPQLENDKKDNKLNPKSVLFVGDSITANEYNNKPISIVYSQQIKNKLKDKGIWVDVLASVGKTTSWMLQNLPQKLNSRKYGRVYIYGGINDIFAGLSKEKAYSNIQKMVDLINKNGAEAYVIIGYDANKIMSKLKTTKLLPTQKSIYNVKSKYIEFQDNLEKNIKNAHFVEKIDLGERTTDGVHPTAEGQKIIAEKVLETII